MAAAALLEVQDLAVAFGSRRALHPVTRAVSFVVAPGEVVGIVGESGCGKTLTGLAIMGLLPRRGCRVSGRILFEGRDLVGLSERQLRRLRGRAISMVFQEPMTALDPVFTVGAQIAETIGWHFDVGTRKARLRAIDALASVGLPNPTERYDAYPHELSGGMRQRVMIAMALACEPRLLIADEPTTALDVTVQAQVLELLVAQSRRLGAALLLITHDLGVVAETCDRMLTMYAGEVVEDGTVDDVLTRPRHPYTSGLLRSMPRLSARRSALPSIRGQVPSPSAMPAGCRFATRCDDAQRECLEVQELRDTAGHAVRCCRSDALVLPGALP